MGRRPDAYNYALVAWLHEFYGAGRKFSSGRQWSIQAGRSANSVYAIEESGYATPENLIALARAAEVSPVKAIVVGGHLTQEEGDPATLGLAQSEEELLRCFRTLDPVHQELVHELCRQLAGTVSRQAREAP